MDTIIGETSGKLDFAIQSFKIETLAVVFLLGQVIPNPNSSESWFSRGWVRGDMGSGFMREKSKIPGDSWVLGGVREIKVLRSHAEHDPRKVKRSSEK